LDLSVPKKLPLVKQIIEEEVYVFRTLDELFDCDSKRRLTVYNPGLGLPWSSDNRNRAITEEEEDCDIVLYSLNLKYKVNPEYIAWKKKFDERVLAAKLKKIAKAKYKLMVRKIYKIRLDKANLLTDEHDITFYKLFILLVSIYGFNTVTNVDIMCSLAVYNMLVWHK
jgi:hypothetical protein